MRFRVSPITAAHDRTVEKWMVGSNRKYMAAGGWDKNTLKPGDVIIGSGFRYSDGSNVLELRKIVMASGKELFYGDRRSD